MRTYAQQKVSILKYQKKQRVDFKACKILRAKYKKLGDLYESGKINEKQAMKIFTNIDEWQPHLTTPQGNKI